MAVYKSSTVPLEVKKKKQAEEHQPVTGYKNNLSKMTFGLSAPLIPLGNFPETIVMVSATLSPSESRLLSGEQEVVVMEGS